MAIRVYLRESDHGQTDGQANRINKHFLTLFENGNNYNGMF